MNSKIVIGWFAGGEIEPGTFHQSVRVDPREDDAGPSNAGADETDSQTSAKCNLT